MRTLPNLSPEAARLKALVEGGMTVAQALGAHPDLLSVVDEYITYVRIAGEIEGTRDDASAPSHAIAEQVKKLSQRRS